MRHSLGLVCWLGLLAGITTMAHGAEEIPITGRAHPEMEPFDTMMTRFLAEHHVVGAALAVTRAGKLVYARGFGWANKEAQTKVAPGSRFRIASVSKPITAVAVLRLVEEGKLKLGDRAFELLKLQPLPQAGFKADGRSNAITVLELLQHRGGFDRDKSLDPMFQSVPFAEIAGHASPATPTDIIRIMEGRPLDFAPGERYAYSNFGYCVLGRLIESVSGRAYGTFVKQTVLLPLKIEHMELGRTLLRERADGEVHYYPGKPQLGKSIFPGIKQEVAQPYGWWCLESMDSHGGWIASAPDLVRFASALDDPVESGILKPATVAEMFKRPPGAAGLEGGKPEGKPAAVWYGCGWSVREAGGGKINTWHTGLLDGTSSLLVRRADGLDWAVLFNQDCDENGKVLADLIDPLVHKAADAVKQWPAGLERDKLWP